MHWGAILDTARIRRGAILAVQGSLSRGAILGLDNIGWSEVRPGPRTLFEKEFEPGDYAGSEPKYQSKRWARFF